MTSYVDRAGLMVAGDPLFCPMASDPAVSLAFQAVRALVF